MKQKTKIQQKGSTKTGNDKLNQEESIFKNSNLVLKLYSPRGLCVTQKFYYFLEIDAGI